MDDDSPALRVRLETSARTLQCLAAAAVFKGVRLGAPAAARCTFHFWDTPALELRQARLVLRTQREHDRKEEDRTRLLLDDTGRGRSYAALVRGEQPEFAALAAAGWKPNASVRKLERDLALLFTATLTSAQRTIAWTDGTRAHLGYERCVLSAADRRPRERLAFELRLDSGDVRRLYELVYDLALQVPAFRLTTADATEWGYAFVRHDAAPPRHAHPIDLPRKATGAMLAVIAGREALAQIGANLDGAVHGTDGEYVHQIRVGIRRLRAADRIAKAARLPAFSPKLEAELRWIWEVLSEARDRDVFGGETWPALRDAATAQVRTTIDGKVRAMREQSAREVKAALGSARLQRLLLAAAWVHASQESIVPSAEDARGARRVSRKLLDRARRKVLRRGKSLARLTPDERHALRRDVKKLRYLAAYAAPLHSKRKGQRFLARIEAVQGTLGTLNDFEVARALLDGSALADAERAELRDALASLPGEAQASAALRPAWTRWRRAAPFWR